MSKLLCINNMTFKDGVNQIGDIVAYFDDEHEFSPAEQEGFDIFTLDCTVNQIKEYMDTVSVDPKLIYKFKVVNPDGVSLSEILLARII